MPKSNNHLSNRSPDMPIQYPYKVIVANGNYQINSHVNLVQIRCPNSVLSADRINLYLPPSPQLGVPLMVVAGAPDQYEGKIVLRPPSGKYIAGAATYEIDPYIGGDQKPFLNIVPAVGSDGLPNGNWDIVGGNAIGLIYAIGGAQNIAADTPTKMSLSPALADAFGEWDDDNDLWTPHEAGRYEVSVQVLVASMAADALAQVIVAASTDDLATSIAGAAMVSSGAAGQLLTASFVIPVQSIGASLQFGFWHNDAGLAGVASKFIRITRAV